MNHFVEGIALVVKVTDSCDDSNIQHLIAKLINFPSLWIIQKYNVSVVTKIDFASNLQEINSTSNFIYYLHENNNNTKMIKVTHMTSL